MDFSGWNAGHEFLVCSSASGIPLIRNLEALTLDTARNNLNDAIGEDSVSLNAKNTMIWGIFLVGVVIGFVAVYLVVAQPMFAQLEQMQRQMATLDTEMQSLVGARNHAWETGNLLADLKSLKNQLHDSRATVRDIRLLRQDLLEEAKHTAKASSALFDMAKLQEFALDQHDLTSPAARSLEQLAQIQKRLVQEHAGTPKAEETLADLSRVRSDLAELLILKAQIAINGADVAAARTTAGELLSLKDQIVSKGQDAEAARTTADELLSLKDQIVTKGQDTEAARTNANRLFVLQDELKTQGADLPDAFSSLDRLIEIKDKLVDQTPAVADAVQNLEIISDFQEEFGEQIRALGRMREGLLQIVLMEGTLAKVAKILEPLSQIANVRRLSDRELREAARSILENRSTRISAKPGAPRHLPNEAAIDPFDQPFGNSGSTNEGSEAGPVPPPQTLPLSN